jgi:hypothetical protein
MDRLLAGDLSKLELESALQQTILAHLDQYRLLTTNVVVREPKYVGVQVQAQIVISEYGSPETIKARVLEYLRCFISPLSLGLLNNELAQFIGANWEGWPFGRSLYIAELYSLIQQIPGVKHVLEVSLNQRPVVPSQETELASLTPEAESKAPEQALAPVQGKLLQVSSDTLLCSLDHQIEIVDL